MRSRLVWGVSPRDNGERHTQLEKDEKIQATIVQPAILDNVSPQADPSPNGPSPLREYWVVSDKPSAYPMRPRLIAEILLVEKCVERKCRLPRDEVPMALLGSFKRSANHKRTDTMRPTY